MVDCRLRINGAAAAGLAWRTTWLDAKVTVRQRYAVRSSLLSTSVEFLPSNLSKNASLRHRFVSETLLKTSSFDEMDATR